MSHVELYRKHRPKLIKHLIDQPEASRVLLSWIRNNTIPHVIMLVGPSGCGKTSAAYILKDRLVGDEINFKELNTSDFRGVDMVRDIRRQCNKGALGGKSRMWLIDEAQGMTKEAQNAFLGILEAPPEQAYFILATTDPQKILTTIKGRCQTIQFKSISYKGLLGLVTDIAKKEKIKTTERVLETIASYAEGSARQALQDLDKISHVKGEKEQLSALTAPTIQTTAMDIVKVLMGWGIQTTWANMVVVLKDLPNETNDIEKIRQAVLTVATNTLLKGSNNPKLSSRITKRVPLIIEAFRDNFFDSRKAGLIIACHEVCNEK